MKFIVKSMYSLLFINCVLYILCIRKVYNKCMNINFFFFTSTLTARWREVIQQGKKKNLRVLISTLKKKKKSDEKEERADLRHNANNEYN